MLLVSNMVLLASLPPMPLHATVPSPLSPDFPLFPHTTKPTINVKADYRSIERLPVYKSCIQLYLASHLACWSVNQVSTATTASSISIGRPTDHVGSLSLLLMNYIPPIYTSFFGNECEIPTHARGI